MSDTPVIAEEQEPGIMVLPGAIGLTSYFSAPTAAALYLEITHLRRSPLSLVVVVVVVDGATAVPLMDGVLGLDTDLPSHHSSRLEVCNVIEGPEPGCEVIATCWHGRKRGKPSPGGRTQVKGPSVCCSTEIFPKMGTWPYASII